MANNPKFYPFFCDVIGAVDGTHINSSPFSAHPPATYDPNERFTQNCLACISWDQKFLYLIIGRDGSAADAMLYARPCFTSPPIPPGKYYLADAHFSGACDTLLVPYSGVRYLPPEWSPANLRPVNEKELFNLRHAQAHLVVKHSFGVWKKRWNILSRAPQFDISIQARIPLALVALHNFIRVHDPDDIEEMLKNRIHKDPIPHLPVDGSSLSQRSQGQAEKEKADAFRDQIAKDMWAAYQAVLQERGEKELEDYLCLDYYID